MTAGLVIVDATGSRSTLNGELVLEGRNAGIDVEVQTPAEFISRASIKVTPRGTCVEPGVSLFIRCWPQAQVGQSESDQIKELELSSFLRATAVLSASPVVNRPSETGWAGKWTGFAALDFLTAIRRPDGRPSQSVRMETYSTVVPLDGEREVQDLHSWASYHRADQFVPRGSYRSRLGQADNWFETIVVAYGSTWSLKGKESCPKAHLLERSREIAAELGLNYAAVSWCIADESETLARIDPFWREAPGWTNTKDLSVALINGLQKQDHVC